MVYLLYFIDVDIAVHDGIDSEGGNTLHAKLFHNVLAVGDDCGEPDVQAIGNLFVDIASHDERHDLDFAVSKDLVLQNLWSGRQMLALPMGMLL